MASDRTSQTGEATAGFVQRPTIPPRSRRVISHSPLEIAAEYRAIVIQLHLGESGSLDFDNTGLRRLQQDSYLRSESRP